MNVTVLGAGAACPRPGGACSGYLLRTRDAAVMVDAGNGTVGNLLRHMPAHHLDAVVISHRHPDHIADLVPLMFSIALPQFDRVPLYVAPGVVDAVCAFGGTGLTSFMERAFVIRDLAGPFDVKDMGITPFPTVHPVPTFGVSVTDGAHTIVYTADSAMHQELPARCAGADLLIAEATNLSHAPMPPGMHMTAREAGELAALSGAGQLVLTHIWMEIDPLDAVDEAAHSYSGPVRAAKEGESYALV